MRRSLNTDAREHTALHHCTPEPISPQLRPRAAATYLGVSLATLWRWHAGRDNFPQARKLGPGVTTFDLAELRAWLDAQPLSPRTCARK